MAIFLQLLCPLALPTSVCESPNCFISLSVLGMSSYSDSSQSTGCEVASHYDPNCISLMANDIVYIFHMLINHTSIFYSKILCRFKPCSHGPVAWLDQFGLICLLGGACFFQDGGNFCLQEWHGAKIN